MSPTCHICDQPLVEPDVAECQNCGRPFHLAMTQDSPTKDCGVVFLPEEDDYVIFLCQSCQQATQQ